ncbi:MAG TPA: hypothetical protein PLV91_00355 [Verrucomicrobiota bacterium]|nr:hypothetical protein [Verrucomicrobiota bacterium]
MNLKNIQPDFSCRGFALVFVLSILILTTGTLFFFISLTVRESQVERALMQSRFALAAAESGANEALQYLVSSKVEPSSLEDASIKEQLEKRWVTNDGRYSNWGFPTNDKLRILAQPEEVGDGDLFYVSGLRSLSDEESEIYSLGINFAGQKEHPLLRLIRIQTVEQAGISTNFLQGEFIATRRFNLLGGVKLSGTNQMDTEGKTNLLMTALSIAYPNQDIFLGSNVIQGHYLINGPLPPPGLEVPDEEGAQAANSNEGTKENILLVGSPEFLANGKQGYETNHLVTRLNWAPFPPRPPPEEGSCAEAPLVNIGTEEAPIMAYQFEAAGDYKITASEPYPLVLKSGAVINLRLPAEYVLAEQSVTMEEGAQMVLFPVGNLTLGTQAFATVEKNWNRLTVWGGALDAEPFPRLVLQGTPNASFCARIYAPFTDVIVTNEVSVVGLLVGREITMAEKTSFLGDSQARLHPLIGSPTPLNTTNSFFRIKAWEEIGLEEEKEVPIGE